MKQKCRWTVFKSVGELSSILSVNCLLKKCVDELSCQWTVLFPSKWYAHLQTMEKTWAKFQKDRYKIIWDVALTRYPLSIHFHRIWGQKNVSMNCLVSELSCSHPNDMHISRPWRKRVQSFKKIGIKLYEVLRSQGTHCLYTFIESEVRKWQGS